MKTKKLFTNKLLSIFLSIAMLLSLVPSFSLTVFAATVAVSEPTFTRNSSNLVSSIYANGTPITIEAGTNGTTSVWYMSGSKRVYLIQNEDLSNAFIYGGIDSDNTLNGSTSITMTGGRVNKIHGGGGNIKGNTYVNISGGTVVQSACGGGALRTHTITGTLTMIVTGGYILYVRGGADSSTSSFSGQTYGYFTSVPSGTVVVSVGGGTNRGATTFSNLIYKDGTTWIVKGSNALVPQGTTMTIAGNETMTLGSGTKITSGTIINNGTVTVNNGGSLSGTITNNGTIYGYGTISGVTNNGAIIKKVTFLGTNVTIDDSAWQNNATNYDDDYEATLIASSGYLLPQSVTVNVGGTDLAASDYTYNSSTGKLTIPTGKITADATVSASAAEPVDISKNHTVTTKNTNYPYTGSEIVPEILLDGATLSTNNYTVISANNINAGNASVTIKGQNGYVGEATVEFKIDPADISDATVTLNSTSGIYTGTAYNPAVTVTWNGKALTEGTDYILELDKNGFTDADTYPVTVIGNGGNFTGTATKFFTVNVAEISNIKMELTDTLAYTGEPQEPPVSPSATAVNGQKVTFKYSKTRTGEYSEDLPTFTEAGTYDVWYQVSAPNHKTVTDQKFTFTIDKATVAEPIIASKTYTGETITAVVPENELYKVTENNGGTDAGEYDVVLTLKDSANYKWASDDTGEKATATLKFEITQATNEWTTTPAISDWTYGETAKAPVGTAKYGTVKVVYSGKANDGTDYSSETAPTKAGSYTATFTVEGTGNYSVLSEPVEFTIAKKELTPSVSGSMTKSYDGTNAVPAGHSLGITLDDVITGNTVSASADFAFAGSNAGTKTINASNITLSGDDAANYKLKSTTASADVGNIIPLDIKTLEPHDYSITFGSNPTYNGKEQTKTVESFVMCGMDVTYEVTGNKGTEVGLYTMVVKATGNFVGTVEEPWQISKKSVTVTAKDQTITYGSTISNAEITPDGLIDGHSVTATLTTSTANVTMDGTITANDAKITDADGADVTANYEISYEGGKLVIEPDTSKIDGLTAENVTSANEADIKAVQEMIENADSVKDEWATISTTCQDLLDAIENAAKATDTENTEKVKDVTDKTVTPEDKTDLEGAKADLEKALEDNSGNYTEDEKKAIEDELGRIDDALEIIGNVEAAEELIGKLPEKISKSDEAAINAADDVYNALTDYEKSLVDGNAKKALDDAKARINEINNLILCLPLLLLVIVIAAIGIILYVRKRKAAKR